MRAPAALLVLALAASALPSASAATFDLGGERIVERALVAGSEAVFEMPLRVNQDGFLYAKVLPTPNNALHDSYRANGSISENKGWLLRLALVDAAGERRELGAFVDSTPTDLVPVARGDAVTLVATLRIPADAAVGGPRQAVYLAVAYRLDGAASGTSSGASMDEARALTLLMTGDLAAVAPPVAAEEGPDEPVEETPNAPPEASTDDPVVPPVQAIPEESTAGGTQVVVVQSLPTWFLVGILLASSVFAAGTLLIGLALARLPRGAGIEVRARVLPRSVPVRVADEDAPAVGRAPAQE